MTSQRVKSVESMGCRSMRTFFDVSLFIDALKGFTANKEWIPRN